MNPSQPEVFWTLRTWPEGQAEDRLAACLSAPELEQYSRLRFEKRRREWLLGRWTAKQLLCAAGEAQPSNNFA